jgi:hypothetical protein
MTIDKVLYDKEHLTIYFESEHNLIRLKWKKFFTSEQYREGLTTALESVNELHAHLFLANLKNMEAIAPGDEDWSIEEFYPRLGKTVLQKMAIVTSLDFFNNTSVKRIVSHSQPFVSFETRYFVDEKDAREWLLG